MTTMLRGAPADYAPVPDQENIWHRVGEDGKPVDGDGFVIALRVGQTVAQFFDEADAVAPPTSADINAERERRIAAGASFPVDGVGDIPLTGRDFDMIVLSQKRVEASVKKDTGSTAADVLFRDAGNTNRMFTPDQMISLVDQGQAWVQAVMQVSWAMKDGTGDFSAGIPADYADDKWWPAAESAGSG